MKNMLFDAAIATDVENAVITYFGCERHDIVQYRDSEVKKVVVFILLHHFGFNKRIIGWNYRITHWYVPTAAKEVKARCDVDNEFSRNVFGVLDSVKPLIHAM
jgi:hypothetical protein